MKNILALMLVAVMCMTFVFAEGEQAGVNQDNNGEAVLVATQNSGADNQIQNRVQDGTYMNEAGDSIRVQTREGNRLQIHVGNVNATTDLIMTQEQVQNRTRLNVQLSNGRNAEIKVMPDTASATALARLGAKCEGECTIELKEVGTGTQVKVAYEIKTQKQAKVLGLFQAQMKVQSQVDAENGEVIQAKKPWWAFIATE